MIILYRLQWNISLKSPPVLGYLWFAFQSDCSNRHPAQNQHQKESRTPRDSHTFRHPSPSHQHPALPGPHPTVVLLMSSRSLRTQGLWEQLTGWPRSAQHLDQVALRICSALRHCTSSQLSDTCAELSHHLEQVFAGTQWLRDQAVLRVRCPSAVCTGCSHGML